MKQVVRAHRPPLSAYAAAAAFRAWPLLAGYLLLSALLGVLLVWNEIVTVQGHVMVPVITRDCLVTRR